MNMELATADRTDGAWDQVVTDTRVHRSVYADPSIFQHEMASIFAGTWVYLLHESEIPNANDFRAARLGSRPVIVTRDAKNQLHVLMNRCTHRGATICREKSGQAATFTCPYHGWRFKNDGKLMGVPGRDAYGNAFSRDRFSLGRAPRVESYRGFVFATLNQEAPDLETHLGQARFFIDQWLDQGGGDGLVVQSSAHRFHLKCNWKLIFDNAGDGYHVPFSHQSLLKMTADRYGGGDMTYFGDADKSSMRVYDLGNGHTLIDQREEMYNPSAWKQQRPQPGRETFEGSVAARKPQDEQSSTLDMAVGSGMNLNIFPNLLLIGNQIQVIEPLSVGETILTWYATTLDGVDEEVNVMRMRTQEDFPILGETDDAANFEACQQGLMSIPEEEWVDISRHVTTNTDRAERDGIVSGPVTSDLHLRAYFRRWKELMKVKPNIQTRPEGDAQ